MLIERRRYTKPMSLKRKLFCLTADQKKEICIYHSNNSNKSQQDIADFFTSKFGQPVSRRSVGDILSDKQKWMEYARAAIGSKKLRAGRHSDMESALQIWFTTARSQNVVITDAVLREKAKQFGSELGITDFQYSNGWLQRFKGRCGIASQVICGESAGVDPAVIRRGRQDAAEVIKGYSLRDVYNLDETGLFFRMLPDRSLTTKDKTKGAKKPKERISVMLCCNADGSDKLRALVIGKTLNPRCFKQFNPKLYCDYYANKKAWMVNGILQDFIKSLNRRMVRENRKILLLMDNAPSHIIPENMKNVRCEFLPPTTTSHLQPMDAGIINAFKAHYRRYLVRFHIDAIDAGRAPKVEVSDAIRWKKLSWDEVTSSTIVNCWHHTGILPVQPELIDCSEGETSSSASAAETTSVVTQSKPALYRDFGNLFERLSIPQELLMTPAEYMEIDNELPTSKLLTDEEIIQLVSGPSKVGSSDEEDGEGEDEEEGEDSQLARVSHTDAAAAVDVLMRYFEQCQQATEDDIQPLCLIKRRVDSLLVAAQKQSSVLDFFTALTD